jgi:transposase
MKLMAFPLYSSIVKAAIVEVGFDHRDELLETLRQAPPPQAISAQDPSSPSTWRLHSLRQAIPQLHDYTLSGVWRWVRRAGVKLRTAQVQQYSPDPDDGVKEAYLLECLRHSARHRDTIAWVFLDEMGYYRWPTPSAVWAPVAPAEAPQAERQAVKQQQWRIIGALNALSGQVDYLDAYRVGRARVIDFYRQLAQCYHWASRVYVVQDNGNIHRHDDVLEVLATMPQIEPVWLPTYAPWLNPIEKLWRWLKQSVIQMHRLAADWPELRRRVNTFLDQFAEGSSELLQYVGLAGKGKLAQAIRNP